MAQNYYYAVARIKTLENELISNSLVNRMLEAPDAMEALKYLSETSYRTHLSDISDPRDFELVLEKGMESTYEMIDRSTENPEITKVSRIKNDYNNLKILLKSYFLEVERDELLSKFGMVDINALKASVQNKEFRDVPKLVEEAVLQVMEDFELNGNPQNIDLIVDKKMYQHIRESVKKLNMKPYEEYLKVEIDMINLKTFLRIRRIGGDFNFFQKAFIEGGSITLDEFQKFFLENLSVVGDLFSYTPYGSFLTEAFKQFMESGSITEFEKDCDNYLLKVAKEGKNLAFGAGPILGYIKAKENENKAIRIIMVGKINNIPSSMIRGRLRDLYV